jgi:hypothetical protein
VKGAFAISHIAKSGFLVAMFLSPFESRSPKLHTGNVINGPDHDLDLTVQIESRYRISRNRGFVALCFCQLLNPDPSKLR